MQYFQLALRFKLVSSSLYSLFFKQEAWKVGSPLIYSSEPQRPRAPGFLGRVLTGSLVSGLWLRLFLAWCTSQWPRNRKKGMNPSSASVIIGLTCSFRVIPPTSALRVLKGPSRVMTANAFQNAREKHKALP